MSFPDGAYNSGSVLDIAYDYDNGSVLDSAYGFGSVLDIVYDPEFI